MSGARVALSFLTRVPAAGSADEDRDVARAIPWFPVVGAAIGAAIAVVYATCSMILPNPIAATLALAAGILLTGGFHEDGLGDTADAFGGGWTRDERLRIMKDSRQGTFGVLAIVLSILVRITAIAALSPSVAAAVIPSTHALARSGAMTLVTVLRPASIDGLGASYAGAGSRGVVAVAVLVGVVIGTALTGVWVAGFVAAAIVAVVAVGLLAARKIGGVTGDVLGAAEQVCEMAILVVAAAIVTEGRRSPVLWW